MPARRHIRIPVLGKAAPPIGSDFVSLEAASGIVLLLAAAAALVWANSNTAGYTSWWHHDLTFGPGDLATLFVRADAALYAAKQAGRNRLRLAI